jgi:hypothetical protein
MINIADHYWIIAGSATDVYQSKSNTLVPVGDADYAAWQAAKGDASPIASEAELAETLQANGSPLPAWLLAAPSFIQPTPTTYTTEQLKAYSADARYRYASGGVVVTSVGGSVPFLTDVVARNTINSAYDYLTAQGAGASVSWKMSDGSFVTIDTAQMTTVMNSVAAFVQSCFAKESTNMMGIEEGSITDLATIDNSYASISNVFP